MKCLAHSIERCKCERRETRRYGLFERDGTKWKDISGGLYLPKSKAVRLWQNALLAGAFGPSPERRLRPVKGGMGAYEG